MTDLGTLVFSSSDEISSVLGELKVVDLVLKLVDFLVHELFSGLP